LTDEFIRRALKALASEMSKETQARMREQAKGKTLQEQLDMLTAEAMKSYVEPDFLKPRVEVKDTMGLLRGKG
jgi:Arc/MetJ-type ribon-helix-helix transcriptional regulator